jgi:hypothetical protein
MNQSEKHKFEEEWERMFESASETPPPTVWDAIEKRLDKDGVAPIIPLVWWKNPKVAYAAAAAVALLLVSWPILQLTRERSENAPQVATRSLSTDSAEETTLPEAGRPATADQEALAKAGQQTGPARTIDTRSRRTPLTDSPASSADQPLLAGRNAAQAPLADEVPTAATGKNPLEAAQPSALALGIPTQKSTTGPDRANSGSMGTEDRYLGPTLRESIALLSPVGVSEVDVYMQKRFVFYNYEFPEAEIAPPTRSREYWAGVGVMPASFNPGVSVTSPPAAFSMAKASRQSLSNSSKAGLSYAVQMQTGMKLSKHWTLETGLSYLQGNSTFQSDGYVLDASTNRSANVLEGALLANTTASREYAFSPGLSQDMNTAAVYIDLDQSTGNNYRFMQVPVQAGYVLNPDGKVNYTILGGTVANVFLQNEIESGAGNSFVNTADDGIYRSLSWSAATGVRLNYRLSDHWSANLTGSYQKALTTSMRSTGSLEARPQLYGVAWGVRYVF